MAINTALQQVAHDTTDRPIPLHLRNAPTKLMKELGYSDNYKYAHDYAGNFTEQEFMPVGLEANGFMSLGTTPKSEN